MPMCRRASRPLQLHECAKKCHIACAAHPRWLSLSLSPSLCVSPSLSLSLSIFWSLLLAASPFSVSLSFHFVLRQEPRPLRRQLAWARAPKSSAVAALARAQPRRDKKQALHATTCLSWEWTKWRPNTRLCSDAKTSRDSARFSHEGLRAILGTVLVGGWVMVAYGSQAKHMLCQSLSAIPGLRLYGPPALVSAGRRHGAISCAWEL